MPDPGLARFNTAPDAERDLLDVCSAPRWASAVAAGRPYATADALQDAAAAALTDADLDAALTGHPRIGGRSAGGVSGREQAGVGDAVLAALAEGNRTYEERFGHVYLVCASGRSGEELLATLHARLGHDPATERAVALRELAVINRLRLRRMVASSTLSTHVLDAALGRPAAGVGVRLERDGEVLAEAVSDGDGRVRELGAVDTGTHRITFATGEYFTSTGQAGFYPEVSVTFAVTDVSVHHHIPLLLSPFAYSTYRGS